WTGGLCAHGWSPDGVKTITCKNTPIDPAVDLARVTGRDAFVCSHSVRHRDPGNDMANVQLDRLRKVYPNGHVAVDAATLDIADGELLVLVGPSGCGKSTLLRMIAGLESISAGTLRIGGRVVNDVAPKDRDIAMVFQSYALYPHMSVAENLAFGL